MVPVRRALSDALVSAAAAGSLLFVMIAADDRVRDRVLRGFGSEGPSTALAQAGGQARAAAALVLETARDQSVEHAPLLIFVLVATILLLAMART